MTATTHHFPSDVDANAARVIRTLMAYQGMTQAELADAIGEQRAVLAHRLTGRTGFSAHELAAIADVFDVPVSLFYEPADHLFGNRGSGVSRRYPPGSEFGLAA